MDPGFVDEDVQFVDLEETLSSSFDIVAPNMNLCVVVLWVGFSFVEKFLEKVAGVQCMPDTRGWIRDCVA